MIIKNILPTTSVETILRSLDTFAYLDERSVRLVKGKTPGSKCFCFVDMDSHEVALWSCFMIQSVGWNLLHELNKLSFCPLLACDPVGRPAHQTSSNYDWWSQSICRGSETSEESEVSSTAKHDLIFKMPTILSVGDGMVLHFYVSDCVLYPPPTTAIGERMINQTLLFWVFRLMSWRLLF